MQRYDVIIIGTGVAGFSAAIYAARYDLKTLVVGKELGGATATAWIIENYPGFRSIDGYELIQKMQQHARAFGAQITNEEIISAKRDGHSFIFTSKTGNTLETCAVIIATGAQRRMLGLSNEQMLLGHGVNYCLTCDAPLYKDKTIAIVGGGDASVKGIPFAAQYARAIYLIVRDKTLNAEPINIDALAKHKEKLHILYETEVTSLTGTKKLERITLSMPYKDKRELTVDGIFIEIGATPNTTLAEMLGVTLDTHGYINVDAEMKTNIDGVFAAGDVSNATPHFKQDITAAAQGALAASSAFHDLNTHGHNICPWHAKPAAKTS